MFYILRTTHSTPLYFSNMDRLGQFLNHYTKKINTSGSQTRLENIIIDKVSAEIPGNLKMWEPEEEEKEEKIKKEKKPSIKLTNEERKTKMEIEIENLENKLKKKREQYNKFMKKITVEK
jgi:uncharacterized protein with gpF-like domain